MAAGTGRSARGSRKAAFRDRNASRQPKLNSIVFRHALRVGAPAALAAAFTHTLALPRGYWVTISAMAILLPYTDQTFRKWMQRIVGTVIGGIIAALLVASVHDPSLRLVMIFLAAATSLSVLPINYGTYANPVVR